MQVQQTITLYLTETEAQSFALEVAEMESLLLQTPDQGNTRTGMAVIRQIRDQLAARGLGVYQQQAPQPPNPTGPVVQAAQGYQGYPAQNYQPYSG
jgi:hypothetical protein